MRIAIYARISTKDKGQSTDNQTEQLREYCARQRTGVCILQRHRDAAYGE